MLDTLIDTIETLNPQERLILLLTDLETYRNMQLLNDLLSEGVSMTKKTDPAVHQESLDIIDDVLFSDYQKLVKKEERGNTYLLGITGLFNRFYFDQYLKPEWDVKDTYKEEFDKIRNEIKMYLGNTNTAQRTKIEECKKFIIEDFEAQNEKNPLESLYLTERFGETFSYIDNMMNQFF